MSNYKFKVCTRCMTYNQAPYIEETLKGFCGQKTTFPVVYAIVDDASNDSAPVIILNYLKSNFNFSSQDAISNEETDDYTLFFAPHNNNVNCYFLVVLLKYNHYQIKKSKDVHILNWLNEALFVATCEGDDYWTDPLKLQKQVGFMEKHHECSACATNSMIIDENGKSKSVFSKTKSRYIKCMDEIVVNRQFHTASVLWRNDCLKEIYDKFTWDTYWWCTLLTKGFIWYDDTVTCVYRIGGQGVTNTTLRLKWVETNENWSNILYEQFGPKYLSYAGAYLSLTRDILSLLILNKTLSDEERRIIKNKYYKYANWRVNIKNIPFVFSLYRRKLITLVRSAVK